VLRPALLALSGTAFPLNNSAIYATLELTLIGLSPG
jgi:hypothetical protein